jgi:predicted membrane protein
VCAAAVTYQEYSVRVIGPDWVSMGTGPGNEESEQLQNVLRVCGVLQLVVCLCQTIIWHDYREICVRSKTVREGAVISLVFA